MTKHGEQIRAEKLIVLREADGTMSGRVHRVGSLKAYIACQCDGTQESAVLSICDECGTVEERTVPRLVKNLSGFVGETGFSCSDMSLRCMVCVLPAAQLPKLGIQIT